MGLIRLLYLSFFLIWFYFLEMTRYEYVVKMGLLYISNIKPWNT